MDCTRQVGIVVLVIGLTNCHRSAPNPAHVASRMAMDSATIDRLCAHPDSVRAGLAECVLKDQSSPPGERLKPVQPPPP